VSGTVVLGVVHALAVAPHYHFGSFDDDAAYVLVAKAFASGVGLTGRLPAGYPLVGAYPPGFGALLAPIAWLAPGLVWLYRLLPLVCFVAVFPLTWVWFERHDIRLADRAVVLLLLALSPVLATFATMVMPETVFVVLFLLLMLVAKRWSADPRVLSWWAGGTVLLASGLLWLKEAAVGMVIGLGCWFLIRRAWKKAAISALGPALLFSPVLVARAVVHSPLIGSRYSTDLGVGSGGVVHRLVHVVPHSIAALVETALPLSVVPTGVSPLPTHGPVGLILDVVAWTLPALVALGLYVWIRDHWDLTVPLVCVYVLETLAYPFMNERRFVLVLPVVVTWYVLGVKQLITVLTWLRDRVLMTSRVVMTPRAATLLRFLGLGTALSLVAAPLLAQFPRDYLFDLGESSSAPDGSAYMDLLRRLGSHADVVETTYLWSTSLFTLHRTAFSAYRVPCDDGSVRSAVSIDHGAYLLDAAINRPGVLESDCLLQVVNSAPWAVPLLHTSRDSASVFEFVGPGTAYPARIDLVSDQPALVGADLLWSWQQPVRVEQVILGIAAGRIHPDNPVTIDLLTPGGTWTRVASSPGPVGDKARTPFLAVEFPAAVQASAVRIRAGGDVPSVKDFHVLGSKSS
jgi:hypothetical protein